MIKILCPLAFISVVMWLPTTATAQSTADTPSAEAAAPKPASFTELELPQDASRESLLKFLDSAKATQPTSPDHYQAMQLAIRDSAQKLLTLLDKAKDAALFQRVEFDAVSSKVTLMATMGEDAKQKTLEQIHTFLKERKPLQLQDINTGQMAGLMLELQPNKKPARDTYQLLVDLLEDDKRPEMAGIRFQLEGSVRRLETLGEVFEFEAVTLDGQHIKTADFEGQYVLIEFFTRQCDSCEAVLPNLKAHYAKYYDSGLRVIGIAIEDDPKLLKELVAKQELPWPIVQDNAPVITERLHNKFGVSALPLVLLLNKVGKVVSLEAHGRELDRILQMLFESPTRAAPNPDDAPIPAPPLPS